ncbi:MAG: hypothetical protein HOE90_21210 [Bacteriovoracaceae bacterium]|jgi:hypothetical protein|nr:hypothetical protein [Bacteriovoracaceae bacterium]
MKTILSLLLAVSFISTSYASSKSCTRAFEDAAFDRETGARVAVVAGAIAVAIAATVAVAVAVSDDDDDNRSSSHVDVYTPPVHVQPNHGHHTTHHVEHHYVETHTYHNYYYSDDYYSHEYYSHRHYHRHYHQSYGVYYVDSRDSDDRWFGNNAFDKVLKAYNDAKVWKNSDADFPSTAYLNELNKKVARRVKGLARRQGLTQIVPGIMRNAELKKKDRRVVRNALIKGMEDTKATGYCSRGRYQNKALKRVQVIKRLAQAVLTKRQTHTMTLQPE